MKGKGAVDIVAMALLQSLELPEWEDFPEIGEGDWEAVLGRMRELLDYKIPNELYWRAYGILEQRSEEWTRGENERVS